MRPTWKEEEPHTPETKRAQGLRRVFKTMASFLAECEELGLLTVPASEMESHFLSHHGVNAPMIAEEERAVAAWKAREPKPITPMPGQQVWCITHTRYYPGGGEWDYLYTDDTEQFIAFYATEADAEYAMPHDDEDNHYDTESLVYKEGL